MDPEEAKRRVRQTIQLIGVGLPFAAWWKRVVSEGEIVAKKVRVPFQKEYPGSDFGKPGWEFLPRPCWTCGGLGLSKQECFFCLGNGHLSIPRTLNPIVNVVRGKKKRHFLCRCFLCRGYGLRACQDCDALFTKGGLLMPLPRPEDDQLDDRGMRKRPGWESIPLPERRRRAAPVAPGWAEEESPELKVLEEEKLKPTIESPDFPIKETVTLEREKKKGKKSKRSKKKK